MANIDVYVANQQDRISLGSRRRGKGASSGVGDDTGRGSKSINCCMWTSVIISILTCHLLGIVSLLIASEYLV